MIVHAKVRHAAETKVRGRVKVRHYDAVVPLVVREVSADDAPAAAWWPKPRQSGAPAAAVCLRWFDDALWQPFMEGDSFSFSKLPTGRTCTVGKNEGTAPDEAAAFARTGRRKAELLTAEGLDLLLRVGMGRVETNRNDEYAGTVLAEDPLVRDVVSSDLPGLTAGMQALSGEWVLVGDVAHRRVSHPMYEFGTHIYPTMRTVEADDCEDPGTSWPILRHEEGFAAFRRSAPGRSGSDMARSLRPTILEPSLLAFGMASWMARTVADRVVDHLSTNDGGSWSHGSAVARLGRAGMAAFVGLRDLPAEATPRDALDLLERLDGEHSVAAALDPRGNACKGVMARMRSEVAMAEAELEAVATMPRP